jgi:hypothetical protein
MKKGDLNSKNMPEQNKLLFDLVNEKAGGNVSVTHIVSELLFRGLEPL